VYKDGPSQFSINHPTVASQRRFSVYNGIPEEKGDDAQTSFGSSFPDSRLWWFCFLP
jgi:hypothetical protein